MHGSQILYPLLYSETSVFKQHRLNNQISTLQEIIAFDVEFILKGKVVGLH